MRRPHLALVLSFCGACTTAATGTDPGTARSGEPVVPDPGVAASGPPTKESLLERFEADLGRPGRAMGADCKVTATDIREQKSGYHPYEGRVAYACGEDVAEARYVLGPRSGRWLPWEPVR